MEERQAQAAIEQHLRDERTLVHFAANDGFEPNVTYAARCTNGRFGDLYFKVSEITFTA